MKLAQVDYALCRSCDKCASRRACRTKALIQLDRGEPAIVKTGDCMGCGDCVPACPHQAIKMKEG